MYLKNLEIQGFKSFADKIMLDFNPGITSVVGPNGSGKSNISDAVRWVLGEQSIKALRGGKMEDVIFAGTEHRKPLGFAEVSITIENSDRSLPIEFNEVTITRRIYRSGECEYFINKTACRLKDINELLLDTGIGRDGYSIIGQGKIDDILSAKSEDRRHIFEEASGIMKYKVRKIEAEKKLEQTKQNLLRIDDIIGELESQIEPLRVQSESAKKYLALRENLKELEINVYLENISKIKDTMKQIEDQISIINDNISKENASLDDINKNNRQKTELLKHLEEKLEKLRQEYYDLESNLEKCKSEIRLNSEKISNLEQNNSRIKIEIDDLEQKSASISDEEKLKTDKLKHLDESYEKYSKLLSEYENKMNELMALLDESERNIENLKESIMDKIDIQSDKRTQINNMKMHIESLKKRQNSISGEVSQMNLEIDRECMKKEDLTDNINNAKKLFTEASKELKEFSDQRASKSVQLEQLRKEQGSVKSDIQFKTSRSKMLKDMDRNLEGYNRSVKMILQACKQSEKLGRGIHGALAQLIKVEEKYETAIEIALGGALQNIVTTSEEDAKLAIAYLKTNRLGRATFLPVSAVKGRNFEENLAHEIKGMKGFCGFASNLLKYNPEYEGIIRSLLGRVVVVEDIDAGIAVARRFKYTFKIVTLEGDLLNAGGSMSGGSSSDKSSGILSRSREITELDENIGKLRDKDVSIEKTCLEIVSIINSLDIKISELQKNIRDYELIKARDESHLMQIEENIKRYASRVDMLKQEKNQTARQEVEAAAELDKYVSELEVIENNIAGMKNTIAEHQEKQKDDRSARDILHKDITDYKISVNSIKESMQITNDDLSRIRKEKEASRINAEKRLREINNNNKEILSLTQQNEGLTNTLRRIDEEKTGKNLATDRAAEDKKVLEEELYDATNKINTINSNINILRSECSRIELRKAKLEVEMEGMQNRMWDEYELTYTNALQYKKDIGSIAQAQKRINELRNLMKELGTVNVGAIDEYIKTKERWEFMTAQRNDMQQAQGKLHKIIDEMVTLMRQQFVQQFKLINENFGIVFKELFGGGRAELLLADKDDVLESEIEIQVQPPGKRLQNMMLLSGGEKAFTAIALLFAILKLRPTPFCILDEIEAALDEANVSRFARYLKNYAKQTQFAVITHRKGTMEISDTLYGVTMQEHGVSKIVSMKMEGKAS